MTFGCAGGHGGQPLQRPRGGGRRGADRAVTPGGGGESRVRQRGEGARIGVAPSQFDRVRAGREQVAQGLLSLGFARVTLDLGGYRRGALLGSGSSALEVLAERT